jgi:hypothetical protein
MPVVALRDDLPQWTFGKRLIFVHGRAVNYLLPVNLARGEIEYWSLLEA